MLKGAGSVVIKLLFQHTLLKQKVCRSSLPYNVLLKPLCLSVLSIWAARAANSRSEQFPWGISTPQVVFFGYTVSRRNPSVSWCSHSTVQTQSRSLWEYRKGTHEGNTEEWAYPCILAVHKNAEVFCVKWYSCGFNYVFDLVWSDSLEAAIKILAKAGSPDQISCLQVFPSYLKLLCSDTDHLENNFLSIFHINPC